MKNLLKKFRFSKSIKRNIVVSFVLVLLISIGYSYLSTDLNIEGNTKITIPEWDVHFENVVIPEEYVDFISVDLENNSTYLAFDYTTDGSIKNVSFKFDVVNNGTVDAMLNTDVEYFQTINNIFDVSIRYDDNNVYLTKYDFLEKNSRKTIVVKITDSNVNDHDNDEDFEHETVIDLDYIQATSEAKKNVNCEMTGWLDSGKPTFTSTGGDVESINDVCGSGFANDILGRSTMRPNDSLEFLGQKIIINTRDGLICKNSDQKPGGPVIPMPYCLNYEINVYCCFKE